MFFLHLMLFPTFLETNKSGNKLFFRKTFFFHLMCSSVFLSYIYFQQFLEILKSSPSLTG